MRPADQPGDPALIYLAGAHPPPPGGEITHVASFESSQRRWGWRTPVRVLAEVPIEEAPTLEEIGVPRVSVGRQSRLRLTPEQFERGRRAIESPHRAAFASDTDA